MNCIWMTASRLYKFNRRRGGIARCLELISFFIGSNAISAKATIGYNTTFHHRGVGCVVHDNAIIGSNCHIFQNVTVGSKWPNSRCDGSCPTIGNNVFIGAGAVLIGNINVGNNAIIGANSVLDFDIPDNVICAGVPAKIIGMRKETIIDPE